MSSASIMAQEVIDLLSQKVREILGILDMPDVDGDAIHDLVYRVGQTGKLEEIWRSRSSEKEAN